jgi:hypothetical protein
MARLLRPEHKAAIVLLGVDTHRELRGAYDDSSFCRAWLIDGELAALGGVRSTLLSQMGYVWLALSAKAMQNPVAVVKEARRQLAEIMLVKRQLATTLLDGDDAAYRFAVFMGFSVEQQGLGSQAFGRDGRRTLLHYLGGRDDCRVPLGNGSAVVVQYAGMN